LLFVLWTHLPPPSSFLPLNKDNFYGGTRIPISRPQQSTEQLSKSYEETNGRMLKKEERWETPFSTGQKRSSLVLSRLYNSNIKNKNQLQTHWPVQNFFDKCYSTTLQKAGIKMTCAVGRAFMCWRKFQLGDK